MYKVQQKGMSDKHADMKLCMQVLINLSSWL
jgi:hypothetical protein